MNQPSLYPDQISRDRYIKDYDAARPAIVEFNTIYNQIRELNKSINEQAEDLDNLTRWEKFKVLKWYLIPVPVFWFLSSIFMRIGTATEGISGLILKIIGIAMIAYIFFCGFLWLNCKSIYHKSQAYQEELEELEEKRQLVSNLLIKKQNAEQDICSVLGYVPSKYLNTDILPRFYDFIKHNGAATLAEAINMYEKQRQESIAMDEN